MTNPSDLEARIAALEARMEEVVAATARDRAEVGAKFDEHSTAINTLLRLIRRRG